MSRLPASICPICDDEVQAYKILIWEPTGEPLAAFQCNGPNDDEREAVFWTEALKP